MDNRHYLFLCFLRILGRFFHPTSQKPSPVAMLVNVKSSSVNSFLQLNTPQRPQLVRPVEIDVKTKRGKVNPALEYSTVEALALPSDGDKLTENDRPVELSKLDDEVFNNGIVPLADISDIDETKL